MYTNFIHNLLEFLKNVLKGLQNFRQVYPNIPLIFFQNVYKYYSKLIVFSNFCCIFSTVPQALIDAFFFYKLLKFFFKDLLKISIKLQLKFP